MGLHIILLGKRVFRLNKITCLIISLILLSPTSAIADYGLDAPVSVGPFLNGVFPTQTPSAPGTSDWTVVPAFPNIQVDNALVIVPNPNPSNNRLYVASRGGEIRSFENNQSTTESSLFLDLRDRAEAVWDGGFLGMAFHPEFGIPESPYRNYFYVYYSSNCSIDAFDKTRVDLSSCQPIPTNDTDGFFGAYLRMSRFEVVDGSSVANPVADPDSELVMLNIRLYNGSHRGGGMAFGNDGYFYLTIGDQFRYYTAQDISQTLEGGTFRLDVDIIENTGEGWSCGNNSHKPIRTYPAPELLGTGLAPLMGEHFSDETSGQFYCIPDDNPWVGEPGVFEEYNSLGHRNPHRLAVDSLSGRLWSGEVGETSREEINIIQTGHNYGWPYHEGLLPFLNEPDGFSYRGVLTDPVIDFNRDDAHAIIGGYVYRGSTYPELGGRYLAGDYVTGKIWAITLDEASMTATKEEIASFSQIGSLGTWGQDNSGEVYLGNVAAQNDTLYQLQRVNNPIPDPPMWLSDTYAFTDLYNLQAADFFVPYDLNEPFWSDGVIKKRWIAIPNDGLRNTPAEQIGFSPESNWIYPTGTVLMKHFELALDENDPTNKTRLETRFMVLGEDGRWYGVTYRWLADQSNAKLLTGAETQDYQIAKADGGYRTQTWLFPGRDQCSGCHNPAAGGALGPRTHQLNGDFTYPSTGRMDNQLKTWNHLGMFSPTLDEAAIPGYPQSAAKDDLTASLERRALSYLDSNCSYCHRPGTGNRAFFDMRFTTPLANQGIIYGGVIDNLGVLGANVITPGNTQSSIAYLRANTIGTYAMPPLAKSLVDTAGMDLLSEWIENIDPGIATLRINAGGDAYTDTTGNVWLADTNFYNTGNPASSSSAITGTADDPLYRAQRYDQASGAEMQYTFALPNGNYTVKLHFAETYGGVFGTGLRVFDVMMEGALVLDDMDIFDEAGANTAVVKSIPVTVGDGQLDIQFIHQTENPTVSAIEILSAGVSVGADGAIGITPTSVPGDTLTVTVTDADLNTNAGSAETVGVTVVNDATFESEALLLTETGNDTGVFANTVNTTFDTVAGTDDDGTLNTQGGDTVTASYDDALTAAGGIATVTATDTVNSASFAILRLNAGDGAFIDASGNLWSPDTGFYNTGTSATSSNAIAGTADDPLYQDQRYDPAGGAEMQYSFDLPDGDYTVNLYFAENYGGVFGVGLRVFDVLMEGALVLDNLDIFAEAGANTALVETVPVTVSDGQLNIEFIHQTENPTLSAIEILSAGVSVGADGAISITPTSVPGDTLTVTVTDADLNTNAGSAETASATVVNDVTGESEAVLLTETGNDTGVFTGTLNTAFDTVAGTDDDNTMNTQAGDTVTASYDDALTASGGTAMVTATDTVSDGSTVLFRINAGGGAYTDTSSNLWSADTGFNTGSTASNSNPIAGTLDDPLYQTERWDPTSGPNLQYSFAMSNGDYTVKLHFAEIYGGAFGAGLRVFDVMMEGTLVLDNMDIFDEAGANTAVVKSIPVTVSDGQLNILFEPVAESPKISAIEIVTAVGGDSGTTGTIDITPSSEPGDILTVTVTDNDLNTNVGTAESVGVTVVNDVTFESEALLLTETGNDTGIFTGTLNTVFDTVAGTDDDNTMNTQAGNTVTASYDDTLTGSGGTATVTATDTVSDGSTVLFRINAGGGAYTDTSGNPWSADTNFYNTGNAASSSSAIAGTADDPLYRAQRYDPAGGAEMQYTFDLPDGDYTVNLYFAENYSGTFGTGLRIFDVMMEGTLVLDNMDIFDEAGANTAVVKSIPVTVSDGQLNIQFIHQIENPTVSSIEILSLN